PPCYLPQPQDAIPVSESGHMGPIGPWATGRVDWGPLSGLTGTRPVVDKYSIARYSEGDWRAHNKEVLDMTNTEKHKANLIDWNGRQCLEQTQADVDKNQEDNTKRLNQRELEIHRWKCELERSISAASEEISFMEEQRRRLKQASSVLTLPESIAGECLERRTGRMDAELVRDEVEEELIKELALCAEIRDIFARTLKDIEIQLLEDKTAKQRLEFDWSDKTVSHEIDSINMALNNRSTILLFKPGAVIFPEEQSSTDYWEHFTRETLLEGEATRQRSVTLRGTLDAILINAARDLRTQADNVELALSKRIACTEEVTRTMENELKQVLRRLADVEDLLRDLRAAIRRMDAPMKKAQTRLDNRLLRPRVENCRDAPHFGPEAVAFSFFDDDVSFEIKEKMRQKMKEPECSEDFNDESDKEVHVIKKNIYKRSDLEEVGERDEFTSPKTKIFFSCFNIETSFLEKSPSEWDADEGYRRAKTIVEKIRVTNDTAERGVRLMEEYNDKLS
ncbi:hypothetical protein NQ314_002992, partial [Rhamnusium bicolor]